MTILFCIFVWIMLQVPVGMALGSYLKTRSIEL